MLGLTSIAIRRIAILAPYKPIPTLAKLQKMIQKCLDDAKAEHIVSIDLKGKADFADRMFIASGTSQRHILSIADRLVAALKDAGYTHVPVEGRDSSDWVLVDAGDVIVHLFKPEVRGYYNLEKMWAVKLPAPEHAAT